MYAMEEGGDYMEGGESKQREERTRKAAGGKEDKYSMSSHALTKGENGGGG